MDAIFFAKFAWRLEDFFSRLDLEKVMNGQGNEVSLSYFHSED